MVFLGLLQAGHFSTVIFVICNRQNPIGKNSLAKAPILSQMMKYVEIECLGSFLYFVGEQGKQGTNKSFPGPPGRKGDQGAVGRTGAQGPQGAKGEKGQDGVGTSGVKYVRWGRTICPSGSQVVYKGMQKEAYMIVTIMP